MCSSPKSRRRTAIRAAARSAAAIGGLLGGRVGGLLGGIGSKKMEANTVLSLTNVRTTETIATVDGYAAKNSIVVRRRRRRLLRRRRGGGRRRLRQHRHRPHRHAGLHPGLFEDGQRARPGPARRGRHGARRRRRKTFTAQGPGRDARVAAAAAARSIRTLPAGSIVYPTGNKNGLWWEVADENDNVGWVLNTKLAPSN